MAPVGQASRQLRQLPQCSLTGASGGKSATKITLVNAIPSY